MVPECLSSCLSVLAISRPVFGTFPGVSGRLIGAECTTPQPFSFLIRGSNFPRVSVLFSLSISPFFCSPFPSSYREFDRCREKLGQSDTHSRGEHVFVSRYSNLIKRTFNFDETWSDFDSVVELTRRVACFLDVNSILTSAWLNTRSFRFPTDSISVARSVSISASLDLHSRSVKLSPLTSFGRMLIRDRAGENLNTAFSASCFELNPSSFATLFHEKLNVNFENYRKTHGNRSAYELA